MKEGREKARTRRRLLFSGEGKRRRGVRGSGDAAYAGLKGSIGLVLIFVFKLFKDTPLPLNLTTPPSFEVGPSSASC